MAAVSPQTPLGTAAPSFELPDPTGTAHSLDDVRGKNGTVVAFICNHCPYVVAVADRIAQAARDLQGRDIGFVAIMSNDWQAYPQDAPNRMVEFARRYGFEFPYLIDETQEIAKAYGAVCTPDFFGFDSDLKLVYRGRLDESGRMPGPKEAKRDLVDAMLAVADGGPIPENQPSAMGCSIKWRG
ncbi:MAG: thioredoxin family protein [Alphaproteobacteria bacterium]|nr:thioredoxin family protein [Alphaproteobacteria bacterium]